MNYEKSSLIQDIYSLTPLQEGILYHRLADNESTSYISQDVYLIEGTPDEEFLRQGLHFLAKKYSVLRTSILYEKLSKPRQVVLKEREIEYNKVDITGYESKREVILKNDIDRGFDLQKDSLLRVTFITSKNMNYLVWTSHHIILDGWCTSIIIGDFLSYYAQLVKGVQETEIEGRIENEKKETSEFSAYVNWLNDQDKEIAAGYWKKITEGYENIAEIRAMTKPKKTDNQVEREDLIIPVKLTQRLTEVARYNNVTINNIVEAAWGIVLQKYNNSNDVIFGKVVSGREAPLKGMEKMVGICINTIPIRVSTDKDKTLEELINELKEQGIEGKNYEYYSLAEIQRATKQKSELIKTLFVFENYYVDEQKLKASEESLKMTLVQSRNQTNYALSITAAIRGEILRLGIKYDPNIYCKDEICRILAHFGRVIKTIAEKPKTKVFDIEMVTEEENGKIFGEFNNTYVEYPRNKTIVELFEDQVERTPDNLAVVSENEEITYAELNIKANQLAKRLRELGVKPNDFVAIFTERSVEMIIGIYGILKAGGAYVPIDLNFPQARIDHILEDCKPNAILVHKAWIETKLPVIDLSDKEIFTGERTNLEKVNQPDDLIYCTYTSGTTGEPKGIPVRYRNVINLFLWYKDHFRITEKERVILITSLSFDLTQRSIFSPHLAGAALFLCGNGRVYDVWGLTNFIYKMNITMLSCAASMFYSLLYLNEQDGFQKLKSVKKVVLGGESLLFAKIEKFLKNIPDVRITNVYGVTEDSGCVTSYTINEIDENRSVVPIGKPLSNKKIYILDNNKISGIGVIGEICICGEGVTNGYLNKLKITDEKFIKNPYGEGMMYRTSDLGRWLPDGNIEYMGRMDEQVKIRGLRIELGEIESTLRRIENVKDCAVIIREDKDGEMSVYAYIVSEQEISLSGVRDTLGQTLPSYMIPSCIGQIEKIPITRNGKLDRQALPELTPTSEKEYVEPKTEEEVAVIDVIKKVLKIDRVGMYDNIFELGANSISVMLIANRLNQIGCKININEIMKSREIYEIVRGINKKRNLRLNMIRK